MRDIKICTKYFVYYLLFKYAKDDLNPINSPHNGEYRIATAGE